MIVAKEMNSDFGKIPKGCHDYSIFFMQNIKSSPKYGVVYESAQANNFKGVIDL